MVALAVAWGLPACTQLIRHNRLRQHSHCLMFGMAYGIMLVMAAPPAEALWRWAESGQFLWIRPRFADMLQMCVLFGLVSAALLTLCWHVSRRVRGSLRVCDGTRCPACSYDLVACTGTICPECGEPFTPDELLPESHPIGL